MLLYLQYFVSFFYAFREGVCSGQNICVFHWPETTPLLAYMPSLHASDRIQLSIADCIYSCEALRLIFSPSAHKTAHPAMAHLVIYIDTRVPLYEKQMCHML